ncbi:MAG: NADH/ubiquinone/plastoquinone (complex I) [Actinobacteria bacterium QS_5_72_10]|nr:MAG: NADH/ubiquinone/plastoquinone (complex I) [Actinobacteria bacterium QS_5_72_10]
MSALPVLVPVTLIVAALVAGMAGPASQRVAAVVARLGAAGGLALSLLGLMRVLDQGPVTHDLGGWPPPIGIEYVLDPLAAYMTVVITAIGLLVLAFPTRAGFDAAPPARMPLYPLTLVLLAGLSGVVLAGDLFNLFVFLEIYAISTYALVSLGGDRATFAAFRYLIFGTLGSTLYLLGVGFLYFETGTLNMADVAQRLAAIPESSAVLAGLALIVIGLSLKMALFPLHVWMPEAHTFAPPSVAALLAAVQVKAAAYALVRILLSVAPPELVGDGLTATATLAWFGAAGIVFGSVMAIAQRDVKRLLAYSTVAQLGFIGLGIGLANQQGVTGALLHVANHAVMKSCLFLIAGSLLAHTGLRDIPSLAGLGRRMPLTTFAFCLAAASMVGVPPTAGFFSKLYLLLGSIEAGNWVFVVVIAASSLLTAGYFVVMLEQVLTREPVHEAVRTAADPGPAYLAPVMVLAVGVVVLGLGNLSIVDGILAPATSALLAP